ncbi:MAG: recombinase family protein [Pseudorhodoplanes sp.]|nr:recombinase family protein [Pseudorhodoplanes sp.]
MKSYFAYIRVSTQKQGQGVSLQEQRSAIEQYAERQGLTISAWFEERETAAKRGRPIFGQMLRGLKLGKASGVIIHKIDRSARNLRDWADLGELIDSGHEVRFATESLDLNSRGGRLSADIQAVVAADYIRNLREETRKGFYGRLHQGLYPLRAPIGYLDRGRGKPKEPDPAVAPLIRRTFELYATGNYSIDRLLPEVTRLGLRNRFAKPLSLNGLSTILNNPFYAGVIRIRATNETFAGVHAPIIGTELFRRVQDILRGRYAPKAKKHSFLFRRLLRCANCGYSLTGERQKGHVYYSCHTAHCLTTGVREERVDEQIAMVFQLASMTDEEVRALEPEIDRLASSLAEDSQSMRQALTLQHAQLKSRTDRLLDAYMDRIVDRAMFEERRAALVMEMRSVEDQLRALDQGEHVIRLKEIFELVKRLYSAYISTDHEEKRELIDIATSNRRVDRKNVVVELKSPFRELADRTRNTHCDPRRGDVRTLLHIFAETVLGKPAPEASHVPPS